MTNVWTVAAESIPSPSPAFWQDPSTYLNLGVLGYCFYAFMAGRLVSGTAVRDLKGERDVLTTRLIAERDKALADREEMAALLRTELLPTARALAAATEGLMPAPAVMRKLEELLPTLQVFMERDNRSGRRTGDGSGSD